MYYTTQDVAAGSDASMPYGGKVFVPHNGPNPDFQKSASYKEGLTDNEKAKYDDPNTSEDDRAQLEQKGRDTHSNLHPEEKTPDAIVGDVAIAR